MSLLPRVSGRDVVKALLKVGYENDRQRGSHIILRQSTYPHRRIIVPDHKEASVRLAFENGDKLVCAHVARILSAFVLSEFAFG